jgi:hypothetical protein
MSRQRTSTQPTTDPAVIVATDLDLAREGLREHSILADRRQLHRTDLTLGHNRLSRDFAEQPLPAEQSRRRPTDTKVARNR